MLIISPFLSLIISGAANVLSGPPLKKKISPGHDVHMTIVVDVHNMRTESDASPAGDAAVLFSLFEFYSGRQLRLRIRALIAVDPEEPISELADQ